MIRRGKNHLSVQGPKFNDNDIMRESLFFVKGSIWLVRTGRVYTMVRCRVYAGTMRAILRVGMLLALFSCTAAAEVRFNRDIRPIMADTCFRCHGPDKSSRMAGMRLDIREEALKPLRDGMIPSCRAIPRKAPSCSASSPRSARHAAALHHKELTAAQKGHHPAMGGGGREV